MTDEYKSIAKKYQKFAQNSFSWKYIEKPALTKHLKDLVSSDTKILDSGCGYGRVTELLIRLGAQAPNIIGIDLSKEMLKLARSNLKDVTFIQGNIVSDIKNFAKFDLIVSSMVLEHCDPKELKKVLVNFSKWLSIGGWLIFLVPHPMRVSISNNIDYFDQVQIKGKTPWGKPLFYFSRPLVDYIKATIKAGFIIEAVDEPEILKEGKKEKRQFKEYSKYPARLIIKAKK